MKTKMTALRVLLLMSLACNALGHGSTGVLAAESSDTQSAKTLDAAYRFSYLIDPDQLIELKASDTGFDLYAEYDSSIHPMGAGEVVYVGNFGEYKNLVIINHGHRILSTYNGFGRVLVREGQLINHKTVIGQTTDLPVAISIREAGKVVSEQRLKELVKD